jgi:N-acetyl-anhydromuramyl-L-alanine amidase AmpD
LIEVTGIENFKSQLVVRAFQMRFREGVYTGFLDLETAAIIYALHKKYI